MKTFWILTTIPNAVRKPRPARQGLTEVRMQMVTDSLQYLTSLTSEAHIDKDLALEIAYRRRCVSSS